MNVKRCETCGHETAIPDPPEPPEVPEPKFKVGDRVRITTQAYGPWFAKEGTVERCRQGGKNLVQTKEFGSGAFRDDDLELVEIPKPFRISEHGALQAAVESAAKALSDLSIAIRSGEHT